MKVVIAGLIAGGFSYGANYLWNESDFLNPQIGLIEKPNAIATSLPARMSKRQPPASVKDSAHAQYLAFISSGNEFVSERGGGEDSRWRHVYRQSH